MKKSLEPLYSSLIEKQMKEAYESLINDHKKVVQKYEQQLRDDKKLIEDKDRHIQAYRDSTQIKDQLIAKHYKLFEMLKQQFPETREVLDKMDL